MSRSPGIDDLVRARAGSHPQRHDRLRRAWRRCAPASRATPRAGTVFNAHVSDLGYALLLKRYAPNVTDATAAADRARPRSTPCRRSRRCSGASGSWPGSASASSRCSPARSVLASRRQLERSPLFLRLCALVAAAALDRRRAGLVSSPRYGRQPWAIDGVLPTFLVGLQRLARQQCLDLAGGLRAALFGARRGRAHADGARDPRRAGRPEDAAGSSAAFALAVAAE